MGSVRGQTQRVKKWKDRFPNRCSVSPAHGTTPAVRISYLGVLAHRGPDRRATDPLSELLLPRSSRPAARRARDAGLAVGLVLPSRRLHNGKEGRGTSQGNPAHGPILPAYVGREGLSR